MPGVETTPNPSFASAARVRARRRGNTLQKIAPRRSSPLLADRAPRIWRGNAIGYPKEGLGEVSTQDVNTTQAIGNHPLPLLCQRGAGAHAQEGKQCAAARSKQIVSPPC